MTHAIDATTPEYSHSRQQVKRVKATNHANGTDYGFLIKFTTVVMVVGAFAYMAFVTLSTGVSVVA